MKKLLFAALPLLFVMPLAAQNYTLASPDGRLVVDIEVGQKLVYTLTHDGERILQPSELALELEDGRVFGVGSRLRDTHTRSADEIIEAPFYKRSQVGDRYNELTLHFRERFSVVLRAYDDGMAYRFVTDCRDDFVVLDETARFDFGQDRDAIVPYVRNTTLEFGPGEEIDVAKALDEQWMNSFQNLYTHSSLSGLNAHRLIFTPVVVGVQGRWVCIAESDTEHYPGMFLMNPDGGTTLCGRFAPVPKRIEIGGSKMTQGLVREREEYIARCAGRTSFPWRIVIVATEDRQLADSDMVYRLASPNRIGDTSWIEPGKVAWEWWNAWGLTGVDFKAGTNNETYMAYIDFAARHGIEYVILDEGWNVRYNNDLLEVVPEIDVQLLVDYAAARNVGIILWAGYHAFDRDMENVCRHYSAMGVKGFKIDFMDRDDQPMVDFHYRAAETAARYRLILNFHGTYKPTGLNRAYPNVLNFEGVHGLEQLKWNDASFDQVTYDVTMPFIRQVAGPSDYTPGAMRNATRRNFRPIRHEPMSLGTRCRQLAAYVVFEAPLTMLCDSPSAYEREPECTAFIAGVPTVWDETAVLNGRIAEYITIARRKGNVWHIGPRNGDRSFVPRSR